MSDFQPGEETKVAYYSPNDDIPKLIRINKPLDTVTLGDFKQAINLKAGRHKFFFKNHLEDVGFVKEQLTDDDARLPSVKGHVTCYIETDHPPDNCDPHSGHHHHHHHHHHKCSCDTCSEADSTSCVDSDLDDDDSISRVSTTTDGTSVSNSHRSRDRYHRMHLLSRASSVTTMSDSTVYAKVIEVQLDLDELNFLGMSLVGHSNDGGIYVGSIMSGGAVAKDGRIQPGDMILQVNDTSFDGMSNDDAVKVIRVAVEKLGRIKLIVAKSWESDPRSYFTVPRGEPVQRLDLEAWVNHTEAARRLSKPDDYTMRPPSVSTLTSTSSSIPSSFADCSDQRQLLESALLYKGMDMEEIARSMAKRDSGLDIRDREWLKIHLPNAFLGSDVVNWLYNHVQGFESKSDAEKYAQKMFTKGLIRHAVDQNKSFSKQRYYIFDPSIFQEDHYSDVHNSPSDEFQSLRINSNNSPARIDIL
ncbi:segment polarity protein dishevelled homolog DVL-3-like [Brevipalpus obovatus]|uniref:segment polarity protein dishevelled homolog DVL-3-like n=1 Tax=Brevipalpus obovatus TaxID=246614 RepID=UPI003D9F928F